MPHFRAVARTIVALSTLGVGAASHAIVNGSATSQFDAIGEIGGASGVLIADNWVLTAAHVAQSLTAGSSRFVSQAGASSVSAVFTFGTAAFPNDDIALVQLSSPLDIDTPVLNDEAIVTAQLPTLGSLTMVSAQNQAPNGFALTTAYDAPETYAEAGQNASVNWILTRGGAHLQGGDSGGALFRGATSDSAGELLLGIASAVLHDAGSGATDGSAFVQVARYRSWIDATMASSGQQATWVSSVPEASSLMLLVAGGFALAGLRTGQKSQNG